MNRAPPVRPHFIEAPSTPCLSLSSTSSWEGREVRSYRLKPVYSTEIDIPKWVKGFEEFKIKYAEIYKRKHKDFNLPVYRS